MKIEFIPAGTRVSPATQKEYAVFTLTVNGKPIPGGHAWSAKGTRRRAESLERVMEHASGDLAFAIWLVDVDLLCTSHLGVGLFDLPDMMTRDSFDKGVMPEAGD